MASGVAVPDALVETLKDMKLKKLDKPYTWMTIVFKPSISAPESLAIGDKGTGNYDEFKAHLTKQKDGCYGVVDVPLSKGSKLILVSWAPDDLSPKPKMLVASTCGALKGKIEGVDQYQASDVSDLDLKTVQSKVDRKA